MKMTRSFFLVFLFSITSSNASWLPLPHEMQRLCARAESPIFIPLPETIRAPHPDPLFHAIELGGGAKDIAFFLGEHNPDTFIVHGMTPMIVAALTDNWAAAKDLLDRGADVNFLRDPDVILTPIEAAFINSNYAFACKLIEHSARFPTSKEEKDSFFSSALLVFYKAREPDGAVFVEYLLNNGFDPNDKGSPLETPLMGAVSLSNIPMIKVLLKHGARLDIVKHGDRTVWGVALRKNNKQVLRLLEEAQ
jgi:ankyrin repeat protein